jgi:anti-sigma B factor antagonist
MAIRVPIQPAVKTLDRSVGDGWRLGRVWGERSQGIIAGVEAGIGEKDSRPGSGSDVAEFVVLSEWLTPRAVVVQPQGELDLDSAPELGRELSGVIEGGATVVVVDLETTTFIDSMTIGVLLGAVRRLQQRGGELRIACADPNITRIFEITLLDRVFAIHPSRKAALGISAADR